MDISHKCIHGMPIYNIFGFAFKEAKEVKSFKHLFVN